MTRINSSRARMAAAAPHSAAVDGRLRRRRRRVGRHRAAAAVGTVDGFGSTFIGGERCDDVGARIQHDTVDGGPEPAQAELKLGQRVEAELDGSSAACKILVARISPSCGHGHATTSPLTVAGAQVLVNTDPAVGPVTVFDGYDGAADIQAGDRIEVHGKAVR